MGFHGNYTRRKKSFDRSNNYPGPTTNRLIPLCPTDRAARSHSRRLPNAGTHIEEKPIWRELLTRDRFIEVEWSGEPPYSVTLDPQFVGEDLYTWSSSPNSWTKRIERDPKAIIKDRKQLVSNGGNEGVRR